MESKTHYMQYICSIFSTANEDHFSSDPLKVTCRECRGRLEEAQERARLSAAFRRGWRGRLGRWLVALGERVARGG
jgi:hypothetical protein